MKKEIESKLSFSDRIAGHVKVKVIKKEPDAQNFLCGDKVKTDRDGNEYFIIPEHQAKYISETFPRYTVSKGYLPQDALDNLNAESEANKHSIDTVEQSIEPHEEDNSPPVNDIQEVRETKKEIRKTRGNPNWRKKHTEPEFNTIRNQTLVDEKVI